MDAAQWRQILHPQHPNGGMAIYSSKKFTLPAVGFQFYTCTQQRLSDYIFTHVKLLSDYVLTHMQCCPTGNSMNTYVFTFFGVAAGATKIDAAEFIGERVEHALAHEIYHIQRHFCRDDLAQL